MSAVRFGVGVGVGFTADLHRLFSLVSAGSGYLTTGTLLISPGDSL